MVPLYLWVVLVHAVTLNSPKNPQFRRENPLRRTSILPPTDNGIVCVRLLASALHGSDLTRLVMAGLNNGTAEQVFTDAKTICAAVFVSVLPYSYTPLI